MLTFDRIVELAADAARDLRLSAEVAATPGGAPGNYAEVIITVATKDASRRVLVGIDCSETPREVKRAILAELSDAGSTSGVPTGTVCGALAVDVGRHAHGTAMPPSDSFVVHRFPT